MTQHSENRFENITVFEDGPDMFARNIEGRVLFRFNKIDGAFSVFRSPRMTQDEKDFCVIMLKQLRLPITKMTEKELIDALNYDLNVDLYCT